MTHSENEFPTRWMWRIYSKSIIWLSLLLLLLLLLLLNIWAMKNINDPFNSNSSHLNFVPINYPLEKPPKTHNTYNSIFSFHSNPLKWSMLPTVNSHMNVYDTTPRNTIPKYLHRIVLFYLTFPTVNKVVGRFYSNSSKNNHTYAKFAWTLLQPDHRSKAIESYRSWK